MKPVVISVPCPVCYSKAGELCTAPTNTGQRWVQWTHLAREAAALDAAREAEKEASA